MKEGQGRDVVAYVLGIVSIVLAFFQPGAGIILGIIGLSQSKKEKSDLATKAKKLNKIGITIGVIFIISMIALSYYIGNYCQNNPSTGICIALGGV